MLPRFVRYFTLLFIMFVGFNAQANTHVISSQSSLESAFLLAPVHEDNSVSQDLGESEQPPITSSPRHNYEFTLTEASRYSSAGRLVLNNTTPDYQVEIELSIPTSPSLVIGYAVNINAYQHWLTRAPLSKSRISGWKDSNQLYSHRQYPDVITFT